jgi:hypothetical protein
MASSVIGILSSAGTVVLGGFAVRSAFYDWQDLQMNNPQATTQEKAWIIMKGFLGMLQIGGGTSSLVAEGYKMSHVENCKIREDIRERAAICEKAFEEDLQKLCESNGIVPNAELFDHPKVKELIDKHMGEKTAEALDRLNDSCRDVEIYQNLHKRLCGIEVAQLGIQMALEIKTPDPKLSLRARVTRVMLREGSLIYLSYARTKCDAHMDIDPFCQNGISSVDLLCKGYEVAQKKIEMGKEHRNKKINGKLFTPYQIPESLDDSSLKYREIPARYHDLLPFSEDVCSITLTPIARALFIIQENIPIIYEKNSLVNAFFARRNQGFDLQNPAWGTKCKENEIYECISWNYQRAEDVERMMENEITSLTAQLGGQ